MTKESCCTALTAHRHVASSSLAAVRSGTGPKRCPLKQSTRSRSLAVCFCHFVWPVGRTCAQQHGYTRSDTRTNTRANIHARTLYPCGNKQCGNTPSEEHQAELLKLSTWFGVFVQPSCLLSEGQETHTMGVDDPPGRPISLRLRLSHTHTHMHSKWQIGWRFIVL